MDRRPRKCCWPLHWLFLDLKRSSVAALPCLEIYGCLVLPFGCSSQVTISEQRSPTLFRGLGRFVMSKGKDGCIHPQLLEGTGGCLCRWLQALETCTGIGHWESLCMVLKSSGVGRLVSFVSSFWDGEEYSYVKLISKLK